MAAQLAADWKSSCVASLKTWLRNFRKGERTTDATNAKNSEKKSKQNLKRMHLKQPRPAAAKLAALLASQLAGGGSRWRNDSRQVFAILPLRGPHAHGSSPIPQRVGNGEVHNPSANKPAINHPDALLRVLPAIEMYRSRPRLAIGASGNDVAIYIPHFVDRHFDSGDLSELRTDLVKVLLRASRVDPLYQDPPVADRINRRRVQLLVLIRPGHEV